MPSTGKQSDNIISHTARTAPVFYRNYAGYSNADNKGYCSGILKRREGYILLIG